MAPKDATPLDELLSPWFQAADEETAEERLTQLITAEIEPVIKGIIRFKLRLNAGAPEAADLCQEALAEVFSALQRCRQTPERQPVSDVRGLTATITYRACYRWLRRQSPHRQALRNRLHYTLTRQPRLALWPHALKHLLSGLAAWRGRGDYAAGSQLQQLLANESLQTQAGHCQTRPNIAALGSLLEDVFTTAKLPIEFDELVRVCAALLQVRDEQHGSTETEEGAPIPEAVATDDVAWQVEKRIFLQRLWAEVQSLPITQRAALLLNLRDASGAGCLALFPAVGVANLRQIAAALELPVEQFAALWNQLPLEDAAIADLLKLTRQQVINSRKAARERLARRLRGFF
jgi:DNA-directed RNA polymerase specialized sigma24 family protein